MSESVYRFEEGRLPLLLSVPHDGRELPEDIAATMTPEATALPDTDWHVARLYAFARDMGASVLCANYSRYVIDLNRPANDESLYPGRFGTGLCPLATFDGQPLYLKDKAPNSTEVATRIRRYWSPYHQKIGEELARLRRIHGHAFLWDAHSIASRVPSLFDGELPVLNIGTDDGQSCGTAAKDAVVAVASASPYSWVADGRFRGGYITRHFGSPANGVYAMQLELAQRSYMDEKSLGYDETLAARLTTTLQDMLEAFVATQP